MSPIPKYIARNLLSRPFITIVVLSSMIVVGATTAGVMGVAAGLRRAFASKGHESWVLVTSRGSRAEEDSTLPHEALNALTVGPEVKRFSPEVVVENMVIRASGGVDLVRLRALEPQGFDMHAPKLIEGRMPQTGEYEVIIGDMLQKHLPWLTVGSTIKMLTVDFKIVGVFRADGFLSGDALTTREAVLKDPRRIPLSLLFIETSSESEEQALAARISKDRAHPVQAVSEQEFYTAMAGDHAHLVRAMSLIFILVVTGCVLVASSLLALLQQRRLSEFCVLRALGFRGRAIAMLVFFETELLTLAGGVTGVAIAAFVMRNYTVHSMTENRSGVTFGAAPNLPIAGLAIVVLCVIGLIGAAVPITRAWRIEITRGLREE